MYINEENNNNNNSPKFDTVFSSINPEADLIRPKCSACNLFYNHDTDNQRYICSGCARSIREEDIDYEPDNLNTKHPNEISPSKQRMLEFEEYRRQMMLGSSTMSRLGTQTGADTESSYGDSNNTGGKNTAFYQLGDIHSIVRKQNNAENARYSDLN